MEAYYRLEQFYGIQSSDLVRSISKSKKVVALFFDSIISFQVIILLNAIAK